MSARSGATLVEQQLDNARRTFSQAVGAIQWASLTEAEVDGALWLLYRQLDDILVAALLDENGEGIGSSAYINRTRQSERVSKHPVASLPVLEAFAGKIPFDAAEKKGIAMGEAFLTSGLDYPVIPLAMSVSGKTPGSKWIVTVGLSLASVCKEVSLMASKETDVFLVESRDRIVCRSNDGKVLVPIDPDSI